MERKKKDTAGGTAERSSAVFGAFHGGVDEGSRRTGGWFFTVTKELTLEQILDERQAQLRTQYSIGFVPDGGQAGEYRKLSLQTVQAGLDVQARAGYYAR